MIRDAHRHLVRFAILAVLHVVVVSGLHSLDIGARYSAGNMVFSQTRTEDVTTFSATEFLSELALWSSWDAMDFVTIEAGYASDVVFRNSLYALLHYYEGSLQFAVGPFMGVFNTPGSFFQSGISTKVHIDIPLISMFIEINGDNTIGGELVQIGDYIQERNEIALGYRLNPLVFSAGIAARRFTQKTTEDLDVIDTMNEYTFAVYLPQEDVQFYTTIEACYRMLTKSFVRSSAIVKHTVNSIILRFEIESRIIEDAVWQSNIEVDLYAWGSDLLQTPGSIEPVTRLRLQVGIDYFLDRLLARWSQS